jgi:hypothetical protein
MNVTEFRQEVRMYRRRMGIAPAIWVAAIFGWFGLVRLLINPLALMRNEHGDLLMVAIVHVPFAVLTCGLALFEIRCRGPALQCPHCRAHLNHIYGVVIASRNCSECGQQVLSA